jgi:hypothetical protein
MSTVFANYEEYTKNLNLCIMANDEYIEDIKSIKTYPSFTPYQAVINCTKETKEQMEIISSQKKKDTEKYRSLANLISIK